MTTETSAQTNNSNDEPREPSEILERIETTYAQLLNELQSLSDEELLTRGVTGKWSGKDVMAHVARWEDTAAEAIELHLRGERIEGNYRDIEAWNARWAEQDRDVRLDRIKQRFEESHRRLMDLLHRLSAEQWDRYIQAWVNGATWHHYEEHAEWIHEWRTQEGNSS